MKDIVKYVREPGSAITHFIAFLMAFIGMMPLLRKASMHHHFLALAIFSASMLLLYAASTVYHSVTVSERILKVFKKLDHFMIFILIAGSYTPICLITLEKPLGYQLLAIVWSVAGAGILIKACWINCPKWFSSLIYIVMGWLCILVFGSLLHLLTPSAFLWLLTGGIIYTAGGIIYALKCPVFNTMHQYFGSHEIFHLFVMAGSICHYVFMYRYVA